MRKQSLQTEAQLKRKADRALQDFFREKEPNARCESCGRKAEIRHHFMEGAGFEGIKNRGIYPISEKNER